MNCFSAPPPNEGVAAFEADDGSVLSWFCMAMSRSMIFVRDNVYFSGFADDICSGLAGRILKRRISGSQMSGPADFPAPEESRMPDPAKLV